MSDSRPWFFFSSLTEAPIVFQFSIPRNILVYEKTAGGRGVLARHGGPLVAYIVHIVNNAARKPISRPPVIGAAITIILIFCLVPLRWQIALCCESRINWPIDLYRPLLCLGFHFYVPRTSSRRRYFAFLYRASTPLVDGVHDKSTERADCYRLRWDGTYMY